MLILKFCLLLLVSKLSQSILISNATPGGDQVPIDKKTLESEANTTFDYNPNAFLIGGNSTNKSALDRTRNDSQVKSSLHFLPPADPSTTSARNGRMLDLDALVGDFAASQANKERSQTGNRQSRYLAGQSLDMGGGKRLHIQGFIPIVGVKDVGQGAGLEDGETNDSLEQNDSGLKQQQTRHKIPLASQSNELPYAQSSIGHASYGVQRFLNGDLAPQTSVQQVEAKFSGASVMESLKKPVKKLTAGFGGGEPNQSAINKAGCLCVPFYMCKNGYISESSLGKSQIQQMIAQQQSNQLMSTLVSQQPQLKQQLEMKSSQSAAMSQRFATEQTPAAQSSQQQYADSFVPVDERSFDRELVTLASSGEQTNQTQDNDEQSNLTFNQTTPIEGAPLNMTDELSGVDQSSDYSQEILGRMLGLKSAGSRSSSYSAGTTPAAGVCGLLRTCCNIPVHLFPSQSDMANERLMSQYSPHSGLSPTQQQQQQPFVSTPNNQFAYAGQQQAPADLVGQQQQVVAVNQRFPSQQQQSKLPYGFPFQPMQPLNAPINQAISGPLLAHRSNQFQAAARYQQPQVAQYTRVAPQAQLMQTFQQQQQTKPSSLASLAMNQQLASNQPTQASMRNLPLPSSTGSLGTRKLLEGRCGLRQSAGITGRVQTLQYHESSADFGEYPAQAAILKRLGGSDSLFVCGGTLISQYWVATAAHCIKKHGQADLKVRLGEWDVHRDDEFYPFVEKEIRDLVIHPEFVAGNLVNDIALLRLDSPVDPSLPHVNPACLPTIDESFSRQRCWVTGWGKDSFGQKGSFQAVLREVELPVVGQSECESALRQTRLGPHYRLHSGFICAGGEGGRDACEGDGGSGLYCVQADGLIKVAGLVSWGIGCGQAGVPGVYVNLAHYRPWIENIISIDEDIYSSYPNMMIGNSLISERANPTAIGALAEAQNSTLSPEANGDGSRPKQDR